MLKMKSIFTKKKSLDVGEPFDVDTVPVTPQLRISMESDKVADVAGTKITPQEGQTIFDAVLDHVQIKHVAAQDLPGVRCAARMTDGKIHKFVVDPEGNSHAIVRKTKTARTPLLKNRKALAGVAIGSIAVLAGTGLLATHFLTGPSGTPQGTSRQVTSTAWQAPSEIPKVPVSKFARRSLWTSPKLASAKHAIQVDSNRLAVLASTGKGRQALHFVDMNTGQVTAKIAVPERVTGGLWKRTVHGESVVAWQTASGMHSLSIQNPSVVAVAPAPKRAKLVSASDLILKTKTEALILDKNRTGWVRRVLPAGAQPVAVDGDSVIAVDSSGASWNLTQSKTAPSPTALTGLSGKAAGVIAVSKTHMIYGVRDDQNKLALQAFRLPDLAPDWSVPSTETLSSKPQISPLRTWMISGKLAVDLTSGATASMGRGWRTKAITETDSWSTGFERAHAGAMAEPTPMSSGDTSASAFPRWTTDQIGVFAIRSPQGGLQLWGQPRDTGPYDAIQEEETTQG